VYLKQQDSKNALLILNGDYNNDTILIRAILAAQNKTGQLKHKSFQIELTRLKQRIALLETRNDGLHLDTLAEYYLYIARRPIQAAKWARAHWQNQKTPRDTRLLLHAAIQANDISSIQLVQNWQQQNNLEDHWLKTELNKYASSFIVKVKT
jgi:hypothetical protein